MTRVAAACRAVGRLLLAVARDVRAAASPSAGAQATAAAAAEALVRPDRAAPPPASDTAPAVPPVAPSILEGWFGGPATAAVAEGGAASEGLWIGLIAGIGLLTLTALVAVARREPAVGRAVQRWRSTLVGARAARSELGEALPLLLILGLLVTAIALWIITAG